jgi:CubicO group peptidase (beta-lactamase class C family)
MRTLLALCVALQSVPAQATPEDANRLSREAQKARLDKDPGRAAELSAQALEADPTAGRAYEAAFFAALAGKSDQAIGFLERFLAMPRDPEMPSLNMVADADLDSLRKDARFQRLLDAERARAEKEHAAVGTGLARTTARVAGIDPKALDRLVAEGGRRRTSALIVLRDGKIVTEQYYGGWDTKLEAMSTTKSVVCLAIGMLVDDGKLTLDTPIAEIYPEWKQGRKQRITIRHLLNHTSGLAADRITTAIYASPDFVQFALAADTNAEPGERWFYNNAAVNLLAGVVEKRSGKKLDVFLGERLFAPLGITDVHWMHDRAGNPHAMAGLKIHPLDFAKIGQVVLDGGVWRGKRIVSEDWIRATTAAPGQRFNPRSALLWWLAYDKLVYEVPATWSKDVAARGLEAPLAAKLAALDGRTLTTPELSAALRAAAASDDDRDALMARLVDLNVMPPRIASGPPRAVTAEGWGGQYVVIVPSKRIVAVRMTLLTDGPSELQDFGDFDERVIGLVH